jgi:hypothetical protein
MAGSLALCALLLALAAGASADSATVAGSPATPRAGRYSGNAGPYTLSFKVSSDRKRITHLVTNYNAAADCSIPTGETTISFPALAIKKGRFTGSTVVREPSGISESFSIQGSFSSPTRAGGTVHGNLAVPTFRPCHDHVALAVHRIGA